MEISRIYPRKSEGFEIARCNRRKAADKMAEGEGFEPP